MFGAMIMNSWVSGKLSVFLEIEYAVWIAQDRRSIGGCALAGHLSEFVERTYDVCWKRACERINRICKRIQLITGLNSENTPVPVNFELPPLASFRLLSPPLASYRLLSLSLSLPYLFVDENSLKVQPITWSTAYHVCIRWCWVRHFRLSPTPSHVRECQSSFARLRTNNNRSQPKNRTDAWMSNVVGSPRGLQWPNACF